MIAIPLLLLNNWPFSLLSSNLPMDTIFLWIALVMTVVSGTEYIVKNKQLFSSIGACLQRRCGVDFTYD